MNKMFYQNKISLYLITNQVITNQNLKSWEYLATTSKK